VENLTGGSLNDTLTGNTLDNVLTGEQAATRLRAATATIHSSVAPAMIRSPAATAMISIRLTPIRPGERYGCRSLWRRNRHTRLFRHDEQIGYSESRTDIAQAVNTNLTLTLSANDTLENMIGGSLDDSLTGNSVANVLLGDRAMTR